MRLSLILSCLVALAACTPLPSQGLRTVAGTWADSAAVLDTCAQKSDVSIFLELEQTGADLQGTFTLQSASFPFSSTLTADGRIQGEVRAEDGSGLRAALEPRANRLVGTFTALGETECVGGGASVTVYTVNMRRR